MKKFYSIIVTLILSAVSFAASAYTVTVNIDHPERVSLSSYSLTIPSPLTESFTLESTYTANVGVYTTNSKYFIKSIIDQDGNYIEKQWGTPYLYIDSDHDGTTYYISTGDKETDPKSICYVTVDAPEKIRLALNDDRYNDINNDFEAAPARNTVQFIEGLQSPLFLRAATNEYNTRIYSVKVDGKDVEPDYYNQYSLNVTNESNVEINYAYPDEECEVQIILPDGIPASAITKVSAFYEDKTTPIEVVDSKVFIPMGQYVDFHFSTDYNLKGYTLNDNLPVNLHSTNNFRVFIDSNSTLTVDIALFARFETVVSVNNASAVKLCNFISYGNEIEIPIVDGDNNVTVSEGKPDLRVYASPDGYIKSVTDDSGTEYSLDYWDECYIITVTESGPAKIIVDAETYSTDPVKVTWDDSFAPGLKFTDLVLSVNNVSYPETQVEMDETGFMATPGNSYKLNLNTDAYTFTYSSYGVSDCAYTDYATGTPVNIVSYYGASEFQVVEGGVITLDAAPNPHYIFTITVDDPEAAIVYRRIQSGYDYIKQEITGFEAGVPKEFDIMGTYAPQFIIEPVDNDHFASVFEATNEIILSRTLFTVDNGYDIRVSTGLYDRSSQAVVFVKDMAYADYSFYIRLSDEKTYLRNEIGEEPFWSDGYNTFNFDEKGDNPMTFVINGSTYGGGLFDISKVSLILNDETLVSNDPGYLNYTLNLKNGSVLKAFVNGESPKYDVTFSVQGDKNFTVKRDIITEVDDLSSTLNVHQGTRVDITPDEGETIEVSVNGTPVEIADGKHSFTVDSATDVTIKGKQSGIDTIGAESAAADNDVYNLQGIKILDNATPAQVKALPAGLYIQGGKKIIVK